MKQSYNLYNTVYSLPAQKEREMNLWKGAPLSKQTKGKFGLDAELKKVLIIDFYVRSEFFFRHIMKK